MKWTRWFDSKSKHLVGVDIGSSAIKVVSLSNGDDEYRLAALGQEALPEDTIVDGVIISKLPVVAALQQIFSSQRIRSRNVATSISGHSVIVKRVSLPEQAEADLAEAIQWEAEQYIPFDLADVNVDYQVVGRSSVPHKIEVLLVAAKREKISDHTSVISMAGKVPTVVDIDAFALHNAYEINYPEAGSRVVALLNIGSTVMNINIVRGHEFLFTRDIAIGGHQYTDFLRKELGISYRQAELYKRGLEVPSELDSQVSAVMDSVSENLALEVEKTLEYFRTTTHAEELEQIFLSGGGSRTRGLREYLEETLRLPVSFLDPFRVVEADEEVFPRERLSEVGADFAVAVGLALRKVEEA